MNRDPELDTVLPSPLAEAVRSVADAPLDNAAIERVRLAARQFVDAEGQRSTPLRPPASPPVRWQQSKVRFGRLAIGIATAAMVFAGAWQLLGPSTLESTLYAQVQEATRKVSTIHVISEFKGPNGESKSGELWFSRGTGFACVTSEFTRIDNGKFLWEHVTGTNFGSRSRSQGPDVLLEQELDVKGQLKRNCRRLAEGDREIDQKACRCYQVIAPSVPDEAKPTHPEPEREVFVYVSDDFLVRRMEALEMTGGKWQVRMVRTWKYDVAIPAETFRPAFGPHVEIVDADEAFGRLVDLQTALHVTERSGLIYAVHRAERFENGGVLLMTSVRGTDETLKTFPPERRMLQPGLYRVQGPASNWQVSPLGNPYFEIILATADHEGINAQWRILVPRGRPASALEIEPGKLTATFGVTPLGKFAEHHRTPNGAGLRFSWQETIPVGSSESPASLKTIAESVYAQQALLRTIPFKHLVLDVRDVNGVSSGRNGSIENTRPDEFAAAVAEHLRYWERWDVEFQIKEGFSGTFDPEKNQVVARIPAVFVGYYSVVDDDTLRRFAVRPDVGQVSVRGTRITNAGLAHLKALESLEDLDLAETAVDDTGLVELQGFKSLRRLNVDGSRVTEAGIKQLQAVLPDLEVIGRKP
jgi:hypothetical protein